MTPTYRTIVLMKAAFSLFITALCVVFLLAGCGSSAKEIEQLREEIRILKEENGSLKAQLAGARKEADELYKQLEEKAALEARQKEAQQKEAVAQPPAEKRPAEKPNGKKKKATEKRP